MFDYKLARLSRQKLRSQRYRPVIASGGSYASLDRRTLTGLVLFTIKAVSSRAENPGPFASHLFRKLYRVV